MKVKTILLFRHLKCMKEKYSKQTRKVRSIKTYITKGKSIEEIKVFIKLKSLNYFHILLNVYIYIYIYVFTFIYYIIMCKGIKNARR